jgi:thiosulfate dehydrogenase [quinone] large subunit
MAQGAMMPRIPSAKFQTSALVALRLLIGWHFLYEGLSKLLNPYWTSAGYLAESQWLFKGLFVAIASSPGAVTVVDYLNIWGQILIGVGLMFGLVTRWSAIAGIVLLAFYYLAAPPFVGYTYPMPTEGSYLIVNKVLIELAALLVILAYPTEQSFGLDRFIFRRKRDALEPAVMEATGHA